MPEKKADKTETGDTSKQISSLLSKIYKIIQENAEFGVSNIFLQRRKKFPDSKGFRRPWITE